ncbi:MAG: ATP-binding protein, partial [Patescibacteria group bacterium]|nr:ATP-binding protein [Patescibacteria group bacterium]
QNLAQLPAALRASILGNCGLQAYFRISRADADMLAKESLAPVFNNPPGWEWFIQQLQGLLPTWCVVKNNISQDVATLKTQNIDPPHIMAGATATVLASLVAEARMGGVYLRSRAEVEAEYARRKKELSHDGEPESFRVKRKWEIADRNYADMIKGGENDYVEFKAYLRWDYVQQGNVKKSMEYFVVKAISAFMNSEGGTLFIGVHDSGEILGIEKDYATLKNTKDSFLLQLTQSISRYLGREFNQYTSISIVPIEGKDVCIVEVMKSATPVFLKYDDKEEFYARASASSLSMSVRQASEYIRTHFAQR